MVTNVVAAAGLTVFAGLAFTVLAGLAIVGLIVICVICATLTILVYPGPNCDRLDIGEHPWRAGEPPCQ